MTMCSWCFSLRPLVLLMVVYYWLGSTLYSFRGEVYCFRFCFLPFFWFYLFLILRISFYNVISLFLYIVNLNFFKFVHLIPSDYVILCTLVHFYLLFLLLYIIFFIKKN